MRQTRSATKRAESAKEQDSAAAPSSKTAFPSDKGNGKKMPSKKSVEGKKAKKKKTMMTKSPASTKRQVTFNLEDASLWKERAKQWQLTIGDEDGIPVFFVSNKDVKRANLSDIAAELLAIEAVGKEGKFDCSLLALSLPFSRRALCCHRHQAQQQARQQAREGDQEGGRHREQDSRVLCDPEESSFFPKGGVPSFCFDPLPEACLPTSDCRRTGEGKWSDRPSQDFE